MSCDGTFATTNICCVIHWLQMMRIHAGAVMAKVVDFHAIRYRSDKLCVRDTMRGLGRSVGFNANVAVSLWVSCTTPFPTSVRK